MCWPCVVGLSDMAQNMSAQPVTVYKYQIHWCLVRIKVVYQAFEMGIRCGLNSILLCMCTANDRRRQFSKLRVLRMSY